MRSSIRNNRDRRNVGTYREDRYQTHGPSTVQKTTDAPFTEHSREPLSRQQPIDEPSSTDFKIDAVHELIRDTLAPRVRTMSSNAVLSDRRDFYYYPRKRTGRRCSCFLSETSPDNQCPVCLGVGIVGGYDKYGTATEVLDFTLPDLVLVNVVPNLEENTRPVYFTLEKGYRFGYIEGILPIRANCGWVDTFYLGQPIFNRGTRIHVFDDANGTDAYITKSCDLEPFLRCSSEIRVRIEFTSGDHRPLVSHFMLRYQTLPSMLVPGDVARIDHAYMGTEVGTMEVYAELPIFFDGKVLTSIRNEDVLYRLEDARRFKLNSVTENRFGTILTSTDTMARYLIPGIDHGAIQLLI